MIDVVFQESWPGTTIVLAVLELPRTAWRCAQDHGIVSSKSGTKSQPHSRTTTVPSIVMKCVKTRKYSLFLVHLCCETFFKPRDKDLMNVLSFGSYSENLFKRKLETAKPSIFNPTVLFANQNSDPALN